MGINNLRLSPELIAALYPEALVAGNETDSIKKTVQIKQPDSEPVPAYSFLGKNLRSICFIVDYTDHDFLPEDQLVFLGRILSACKCSLDDIALVNAARLPVYFEDLKKQLHPQIIFLWGILPASVGLNPDLPDFLMSMVDGISVIPVLSPGLMTGESPEGLALKQRLWASLKKLFNL